MITTNERQERLIDQHASLMNPAQAKEMRDAGLGIIESRREGAYVWDQSGTRYIDCRQETSIYNLGRRNPTLIGVLKEALGEYDIGNSLFFSEPRVHLAKKLGRISPGGELRAVTYGVSGAEVNEFALGLSRAQTGRKRVIAMRGSYLESTALTAAARDEAIVPDITFVTYGSVSALRDKMSDDVACVIFESVQNWADVQIPPLGYIEEIRRLCDQFGALMIVDENETCLGRCGTMFAIEKFASGVVPDILTLGKSLSGGLYPIAAAIYRKEYLGFWDKHPLSRLSSFAGSDLGCIIGLETLRLVENQDLGTHASSMGEYFARGMRRLLKRYPRVLKAFRNVGLLAAVDFTSAHLGPQMSRDLSQFGVLASYSQANNATMCITPALIVSKADIDAIIEAFTRSLAGNQSLLMPMRMQSLESLMQG